MTNYIDRGTQTDNTYMEDLAKLKAIETILGNIDKIFKGEYKLDNIQHTYETLCEENKEDEEYDDNEEEEEVEDGLEQLSEDEIAELSITINHLIDEYLDTNLLELSNPDFQKHMISHIAELIYLDLLQGKEPSDNFQETQCYTEVCSLVEIQIDMYLRYNKIPQRSNSITLDDMEEHSSSELEQLEQTLTTLANVPQPAQKTKEWYEFRYNLISASNLWKVFGSQAQVNSLIYEKCKPLEYVFHNYSSNSPMHWGVKYEPVTVSLYEEIYQTQVNDYGCIQHEKYPYIGASPDGINVDKNSVRYGRMLEIKNIFNREITGIPKLEYWVQTQIQMETCDLDKCDFVETRFKEFETEEEFYQDTTSEYKGIILYFTKYIDVSQEISADTADTYNIPIYIYMPLNISLQKEKIDEWISTNKETMNMEGNVLFKTIFWKLDEISCVVIHRNRLWFKHAQPKIKEVWDIIEKERIEGYAHRAAKKRSNSIDETTSPVKESKCLIKLDENEI